VITIEELLNYVVYLVVLGIVLSSISGITTSVKMYRESFDAYVRGIETQLLLNTYISTYRVKGMKTIPVGSMIVRGDTGKSNIDGIYVSLLQNSGDYEPY